MSAADLGNGSREEDSRSITEQLQSPVTWNTLQIDMRTQLTRDVKVTRRQLAFLMLETKTSFPVFQRTYLSTRLNSGLYHFSLILSCPCFHMFLSLI